MRIDGQRRATRGLRIAVLAMLGIAVAAMAAPVMQVEPPVIDLGTLPAPPPNTDVAYSGTFTIRNTGDETLIIHAVKTSCGCTAADMKSRALQPGESEELVVTYKARDVVGRQTKSVYLRTNDETDANRELSIVATFERADGIKAQASQSADAAPVAAEPAATASTSAPMSSVQGFSPRIVGSLLAGRLPNSDMTVVDVRPDQEFTTWHVDGSVSVPGGTVDAIPEAWSRESLLLVVGPDTTANAEAARLYARLGHPAVAYLMGNIETLRNEP